MPTTTSPVVFQKHGTDLGTYWTSPASPAVLRAYLRDCNLTRFKQADAAGDSESGFEQAFASLAYTYLKDRAPRLLDFIVGFQLVERNEDKTKAVGLFGFKVGDEWIYAPTFFLNGSMKGHELQYIKKQDTFVPLKENWVNFIISRKPHQLGDASPRTAHQLGGRMPNLRRIAFPPSSSKYAGDAQVAAWALPALPLVAALLTKRAKALYPERAKTAGDLDFAGVAAQPHRAALAATAAAFDLRAVLGSDFGLLKAAYDQGYRRYPLIKQGFDRFYGPRFFEEMARAARAEATSLDLLKQAASYVLPPRKPKRRPKLRPGPLRLIPDPEPEEHPLKTGALRIFVHDPVLGGTGLLDKVAATPAVSDDVVLVKNTPELDDAERARLLRDTVLIRDERPDHQKSTAYDTQVQTVLANPNDTGLYQVLEKPGTFSRMVVIPGPHSGRGRERFSLVVRLDDPRAWLNSHRTDLWARQTDQPTLTEFRDWVDGLKDRESLAVGGTYVGISDQGSGTCVFTVREAYGDGGYKVVWEDYCPGQADDAVSGSDPSRAGAPYHATPYTSWDAKLWIGKTGGGRCRAHRGELWIPESYRFLEVRPPRRDDAYGPLLIGAGCGCSEPARSAPAPIQPGNLVDVQLLLHEKRASGELTALRIHDTGGGELLLRARGVSERMTTKAALLSLVRDHGLGEAQSRVMLKAAAAVAHRNGAVEYLIKYADLYNGSVLQGGPNAPAFPEPEFGMEQAGPNSYPAIYPQEHAEPVEDLDSSLTDPSIYDPFYLPDQQAMQQAQQAAQSGQKEVFDTSMVAGLLKSVRQDSLVDRYLGDLMKALDKLGRILFMFFWHQEEFADRYGKGDLPELEDSLRNAFEMLGDVCLYLKERTVQGGIGIDADNGKSSPTDASEPNIAETARN